MPAPLARVGVQRDDAVREEVVPRSALAIEVRGGVAGPPIDQVRLAVVRPGHPGAAAAVLPGIVGLRPCLGKGITRPGHGPEPPHERACRLVVTVEVAARAPVAIAHPDHDLVLDDERRLRQPVLLAVVGDARLPNAAPVARVQRNQAAVRRREKEPVLRERDAAVDLGFDSLRKLGPVLPDLPARARVERVHDVRGRDVHDAVAHDRRALLVARAFGLVDPDGLEPLHIGAADRGQPRETAAAVVAVVGEPVLRGRAGQLVRPVILYGRQDRTDDPGDERRSCRRNKGPAGHADIMHWLLLNA